MIDPTIDANLRMKERALIAAAGREAAELPEECDTVVLPHDSISGYEITREIHRGGQGVVYQAIQKSTKRMVAIKVLHEGPLASKSARARFEREIELIAQLKHPCIVAVFDSGTTPEGWRYCAMDYIRGLPLHQHVREHHLTLEQALKIFCDVCEAVQHAHYRGVIHRDLKPSNIMVDSEGKPKILDFGLAKHLIGPVETVVSVTQTVVGTLPYMSPEQAGGNPDHVDTRTDIYALGVVLYEILTGHYPYPVVGHMADVLRNITETPPTPPSRQWTADSGVTERSSRHIRAGRCPIDGELQTVILKTLAKQRERRYQSAGELARDIQHYLLGEPIEAKRDSGWYVLRKALRRHRSMAITALLVLVMTAVFGIYIREQQSQKQAERLAGEGRTLFDEGRPSEALSKLDEALRLVPDFDRALGAKARILKEQYFEKEFSFKNPALLEESLRCCERALELDESRPGLWNLECELLRSLGDPTAAEGACRRALGLDPEYYWAASNLAKALAVQRRFEDALEAARQGVEAAGKRTEPTENDDGVWLTLGTLQLHLGDAQALKALQTAHQIDRKDNRNLMLLARLYLTMPGYQDAAKALELAKDSRSHTELRDPRFDRILAQAYLMNELFEDAARSATDAVEWGDEPAAYALFIGAVAEARLGNMDEAKRRFDQAGKNWPSEFTSGQESIVTAEKGLLWIDTLDELEGLRREAAKAIETAE